VGLSGIKTGVVRRGLGSGKGEGGLDRGVVGFCWWVVMEVIARFGRDSTGGWHPHFL
jgi:hypothetical protein